MYPVPLTSQSDQFQYNRAGPRKLHFMENRQSHIDTPGKPASQLCRARDHFRPLNGLVNLSSSFTFFALTPFGPLKINETRPLGFHLQTTVEFLHN